jgi:hypothetical protein
MLITLQSDSGGNANQFSNYFREPVQIQPGSEIALVAIAYVFENSIVVDATNDTFNIQLGTENLTVVVAQSATYTKATFLVALNVALNTALTTSAYRTQQAFPVTDNYFDWADATESSLKLILAYSPTDWDDDDGLVKSVSGGVIRKGITLANPAMMSASGDGILIQVSTALDTWVDNYAIAGDAVPTTVWGAGANLPTTSSGNIKFRAMETNNLIIVGASVDFAVYATDAEWEDTTSTQIACAINLTNAPNFTIQEWAATTGVLTKITADIVYAKGDAFEIRFPQYTDTGPNHPRYFKNGVELNTFLGGAERYTYPNGEKLYPRASIGDQKQANKVVDGGATYFLADVPNLPTMTITTAGANYKVNDVLTVTGNVTNTVQDFYINTVDGNGGITSITAVTNVVGFTVADTACTCVGTVSGDGNCVITMTVKNSCVITDDGSGAGTYANGNADIHDNAGTLIQANAVNLTTAAGAITDFTWLKTLENEGLSPGDTLQIHQTAVDPGNTTATIKVEALDNDISRIGGLQYTVVENTVNSPLAIHQNLEFQPTANFTTVSGLNPANSVGPTMENIGSTSFGADRESTEMLVNIDQFQIQSMCKEGGVQKAVAIVPFGSREPGSAPAPKIDGQFFQEPYNILYHQLGNKQVENHNQINVRLTDAVGNLLTQLIHPTTITLDLRPKTK